MTLPDLAAHIREHHGNAGNLAKATHNFARLSLTAAIAAGQALNMAKGLLPHGSWGEWLKQEVRELSPDQAQRYMKLAHRIPHVRNLEEIETVCQAYLAVGIMKPPANTQAKLPTSASLRIRSMAAVCRKLEDTAPWMSLSSQERSTLIADVDTLTGALSRIRAQLQKRE